MSEVNEMIDQDDLDQKFVALKELTQSNNTSQSGEQITSAW